MIWFFKLRPAHQYKTMMIATASFSGIVRSCAGCSFAASCVTVVTRDHG